MSASTTLDSRRFTMADQEWFARVSGDANPIHLERVHARRTIAGQVVVHGIHAALWALESYARRRGCASPACLRSISVRFVKPIYLDEDLDVRLNAEGGSEIVTVAAHEQPLLSIVVNGPPARLQKMNGIPDAEWAAAPRALVPADFPGAGGRFPLEADAGELSTVFPSLARVIGRDSLAGVSLLSRVVGMECPGLQSLFTAVALSFDASANASRLMFEVRRSQPTVAPVELGVEGPGFSGTASAFYRPPAVRQPSIDRIAATVDRSEFSGQTALVVGGSRGLGELTAKTIAAGGGALIITYAVGKADASRVAAEIRAFGGKCEIAECDALAGEAELRRLVRQWEGLTHVYYFATPRITGRRERPFEQERLDLFTKFYVTAFADLCSALGRENPMTVFYPSTVFVEQVSMENVEYAMAKAAGEVLCASLDAADGPVRITFRRLPRLMTDQTAAILQTKVEDAASVILETVRVVASTRPSL